MTGNENESERRESGYRAVLDSRDQQIAEQQAEIARLRESEREISCRADRRESQFEEQIQILRRHVQLLTQQRDEAIKSTERLEDEISGLRTSWIRLAEMSDAVAGKSRKFKVRMPVPGNPDVVQVVDAEEILEPQV